MASQSADPASDGGGREGHFFLARGIMPDVGCAGSEQLRRALQDTTLSKHECTKYMSARGRRANPTRAEVFWHQNPFRPFAARLHTTVAPPCRRCCVPITRTSEWSSLLLLGRVPWRGLNFSHHTTVLLLRDKSSSFFSHRSSPTSDAAARSILVLLLVDLLPPPSPSAAYPWTAPSAQACQRSLCAKNSPSCTALSSSKERHCLSNDDRGNEGKVS